MNDKNIFWPPFNYEEFKKSGYLLHRIVQVIGKIKLLTPFEVCWANVPLWILNSGLTTGPIHFDHQVFEISVDFINHQIICQTYDGKVSAFHLHSGSVAEFAQQLLKTLKDLGIDVTINMKPQEVPNPIPFNEDQEIYPYDTIIVNKWWRVLLSSYLVTQKYHAQFKGISPPVGFMWGTFDLRDVRYGTKKVDVADKDFIFRNAMNLEQIECGWWAGSEAYPKAAYYAFTYPQPKDIETVKIKPAAAAWNTQLKEFILNYDDVQKSSDPTSTLFEFYNSTYEIGADLIHWDKKSLTTEKPK